MTSSATPDVIEALRAKPAALSCFEALSPSHRNEYLKWIAVRLGERHGLVPLGQSSLSELAERAQTRARRNVGMIDRLTVGTWVPKAVGRAAPRRADRPERGAR
jgi:hypothetical protein